jgi:hypothetical protein
MPGSMPVARVVVDRKTFCSGGLPSARRRPERNPSSARRMASAGKRNENAGRHGETQFSVANLLMADSCWRSYAVHAVFVAKLPADCIALRSLRERTTSS